MTHNLYEKLGGKQTITKIIEDLYPRLMADPQICRFWNNRGDDGLEREKRLMIDYICFAAGGDVKYEGRDMELTHKGMKINKDDWKSFMVCIRQSMDALEESKDAEEEILRFIDSLKSCIEEI